eukprot:scaffold259461_cov28-Tisochrysis_lutea.AAC.3
MVKAEAAIRGAARERSDISVRVTSTRRQFSPAGAFMSGWKKASCTARRILSPSASGSEVESSESSGRVVSPRTTAAPMERAASAATASSEPYLDETPPRSARSSNLSWSSSISTRSGRLSSITRLISADWRALGVCTVPSTISERAADSTHPAHKGRPRSTTEQSA